MILAEPSSFYDKYTERKRTLVSLRSQIRACTTQHESKLGNDNDTNQNIPAPVDVHGQLLPDAPVGTSRGDRTPVHVLKNTTETLTI